MRDSVTLLCLLIFATDVFIIIAKASAEDGCYWTGNGPSCQDSSCQSDEFVFAESRTGPDGIQCVTGLKKYCCKLAMESQWIGKDDPNNLVTPSSRSVSDCYWTGSPPDCQGFCQEGEYVAATSRKGLGMDCITGSKKLCCKTPAILPSPGFAVQMESIGTTTVSSPTGQSSSLEERGKSCYWSGAAPICDGWCQSGEYVAAQSRKGNDGNMCESGYKKYCCKMWHHRVYPPTIQIFVVNSTVRRYVPTENNESNEYKQTISLPKLTSTVPSWTRITLSPQHNISSSPSSLMGNSNTISLAPLLQTQVNNAATEEKSSTIDNNYELNQTTDSTPASILMNTLRTSSTVSSTKEVNTSSTNGDIPLRISNATNLFESKSNVLNVSKTVSEILSTTMKSTSFKQLTKTAPKTDTYSVNPTELTNKQATTVDTSILSTTMKPATTYLSTTTARAKPIITSLSSSSIPAKLSITSEMPNLLLVHLFEPEDPSTRLRSSSIAMNATEQQTMSESPIEEGNSSSLLLPLLEENKSDNVSAIVKTTTSPSVGTNSLQKLFHSSLSLTTESLSLSSKLDRNPPTSQNPYFHNSNVSELTNSSVFGYPKDLVSNYSISEENKTRIHPQLTTLISSSSTLVPPPKSVLNFSVETENISATENASSITNSTFLSEEMAVKTTPTPQTNEESKVATQSITAVMDSPLFSNNTNPTTQPVDEITAPFPIPTTSAPLSQVTKSTIPINEPLLLSRITTMAPIIKNINITISSTSSSTGMPPLFRTHQSSSATLDGVETTAQEYTISTSSPHSEFRNVNAEISVVMENATQTPTSTINMQTTTTVESVSEDPSSDSHGIEKETSLMPSSSSALSNSTMLIQLIVQNTTRSSSLPSEKQTMNVSTSAKNGTSISPMEPSSPSSIITSTTSTSLNPEPVFDSLNSKLNQTASTPTLIEDASLFIESKENISVAPTTSKPAISTLPRNKGSHSNKSQQKTFQPFIITPVPEMEAVTTSFESSTINDRTSNISSTWSTKQKITLSTASISSFPTPATLRTSITDVLNITIPDMISMASSPIADDETNTAFISTVESEKATTQSQSTNYKTSRFSTTESTPLNPKETTTVAITFETTAPLITSNEGTDFSEVLNPDKQDRMDVERNETPLKTSPSLMLATPVLFPIDQPLSMTLNQKWVPMVAEKSLSHFDDTIARIPMSADMVAIPPLNDLQLFKSKADTLASKESTKANLKSTKPTAGKEFGNIDSSGFIPIIPPIPRN